MTAVDTTPVHEDDLAGLPRLFLTWLVTGSRPEGMLSDDVFADLTTPHWREQAQGPDAVFHLREDGHPWPGRPEVEALDRTTRGFLLKVSERWESEGQQWYCRELIHCVVEGDRISELHISCTGDWDEAVQARHREQVRLLRP
jgi:hypothetical protein